MCLFLNRGKMIFFTGCGCEKFCQIDRLVSRCSQKWNDLS